MLLETHIINDCVKANRLVNVRQSRESVLQDPDPIIHKLSVLLSVLISLRCFIHFQSPNFFVQIKDFVLYCSLPSFELILSFHVTLVLPSMERTFLHPEIHFGEDDLPVGFCFDELVLIYAESVENFAFLSFLDGVEEVLAPVDVDVMLPESFYSLEVEVEGASAHPESHLADDVLRGVLLVDSALGVVSPSAYSGK